MPDAADFAAPLVSTDWLAAQLGDAHLAIVDASWRMPGSGDARDDYLRRHIPGAVFFAIDEIAEKETSLPHMLAKPEVFEAAVGAMGVGNASRVVVYDDQGIFSAARVWWNFRAMGHRAVAVLDGGLPKWLAEGRAVTADIATPMRAAFAAAPDRGLVSAHGQVRAALAGEALVLDARPAPRFAGEAAEPRPGLRRGHMPGAANVPASAVIGPDGCLKQSPALKEIFEAAGLRPGRSVITSCGSGVTAAILSLALDALGHRPSALYDGSWAEWGRGDNSSEEFPVEAGAG